MKLNNKGFTLIETLAAIVILSMLIVFMYPSVIKLINNNKDKNYSKLEESIVSASRLYISDYRYQISLNGTSITKIGNQQINNNKILVSYLVDDGAIELDNNGNIHNPKNDSQCLNLGSSYIIINYNSNLKDFEYSEPVLVWGNSCK